MSGDLFSDDDFAQSFNPLSCDLGDQVSDVSTSAPAPNVVPGNLVGVVDAVEAGSVEQRDSESTDPKDGDGAKTKKRKRPKHSKSRRIGMPSKQAKKRKTEPVAKEVVEDVADTLGEGDAFQKDVNEPVAEGVAIASVVDVAADTVGEGDAFQKDDSNTPKKKYKRRKGQVTSKRKKKSRERPMEIKTTAEEAAISEQLQIENLVSDNEQVKDLIDTSTSKKQYKKRKGILSIRKQKKKHRESKSPSQAESENILDQSMAVVEVPDGDDHLEYEYLRSSQNDDISSSPADLLKENFETNELALQALVNDVSQLLSHANSPWTAIAKDNMCRLTLMTTEPNAAVERTIVWSFEGMEIFIHNKPLPESHFLVDLDIPDSSNLSNVAQFLLQHTSVVESANICQGVTTYTNYWPLAEENGVGYIEANIYGGKSCFRNKNCPLIFMDKKRCHKCDSIRDRFKDRKRRITNARGKDSRKINNRYLPKQSLLGKTSDLAKEKRTLNATIKYLKKKIRKFIEQDTVTVDGDTSADLCKIFKENVHKMTDIQKMFWGEQLKAISRQKSPRSVRWSPMMIKVALQIQMHSPGTYEYLKDSGILKLPSQRRLYDFSHFTDSIDGVQEGILDVLKPKLDQLTKNDYEKFYNLLFDEMTVHQSIVTTKSGQMVGFTSPTDVEKSVADLEAQLQNGEVKREKAKKVLAYMLQGISHDVHEVVAVYPTTELNAQQLFVRTWDVIYSLEIRDIKILSLICDGASCNKKFMSMHSKWDTKEDFVYATKNVAAQEERPLFFIIDPPHLLKTIRNCFANSFGHKCTRNMIKDGEKISWESIELLHSVSVTNKFKTHKLTQAHAKLTPFSRMNVSLATQTMSRSVARSLKDYSSDPRFSDVVNQQLLSFILKVNTFFDCLNGSGDPDGKRNKTNEYLKSYTSLEDERLRTVLKKDILKFFQDWHSDAYSQEGLTKDDMEKRTISDQSYQSLHITIYGFCGAVEFLLREGVPAVDAKMFNQDKLEQYFGILRTAGGGSNNPTYNVVRGSVPGHHAKKAAALPKKKGNTMGVRRDLQVNQEPLPCRNKKKIVIFLKISRNYCLHKYIYLYLYILSVTFQICPKSILLNSLLRSNISNPANFKS